jgi:hypothetical protein
MRSINDITPEEWDKMGRPRKESILQAEYDAHEVARLASVMNKQMTDALSKQEGGSHYKDMKIQPVEFITANSLGFLEGNVVKYICRHQVKNGAEDIKKAIHYCELLLQTKYGESK